MKTFFQDNFLNKKLLDRIKKEIKKDQLQEAIEEINYLNIIQKQVLNENKNNLNLEFSKKLDYVRKKQNI